MSESRLWTSQAGVEPLGLSSKEHVTLVALHLLLKRLPAGREAYDLISEGHANLCRIADSADDISCWLGASVLLLPIQSNSEGLGLNLLLSNDAHDWGL